MEVVKGASTGSDDGLRKVGVAAACVVCCAVPMLVVAGVLTVAGAAVAGAAGAAAVLATFFACRLAYRHRGPWGAATVLAGLAGLAGAVAGLVALSGDDGQGRMLVPAGVLMLALAGFAALAPDVRRRPPPA